MNPWGMALVHHPVLDRRGERVTTAVTNLDIHDLARIGCTYGATRIYLVTPLAEQQRLVLRLLDHWRSGYGATHNPDRSRALGLVEVVSDLATAVDDMGRRGAAPVLPLLTGAARRDGIDAQAARRLHHRQPLLLVFGTGSGLAPELFEQGWPVLEPVRGTGEYNHLPVRAAVAIISDRLFGGAQPLQADS